MVLKLNFVLCGYRVLIPFDEMSIISSLDFLSTIVANQLTVDIKCLLLDSRFCCIDIYVYSYASATGS